MIGEASSIELGFAAAIFSALLGGLRFIDNRFNKLETRSDARFSKLENQMSEALRGRLTRQEHQIWVLQMQVRNPALNFPDPMGEPDSDR